MSGFEIKNLSKSYGEDFTLAPVSLTIQSGEFVTLLGPSGCGKTTLLKLVAGLIAPDGGEVYQQGKELTSVPSENRQFAMMFQQPHLFPHMTIAENVAFGLRMRKVAKKERLKKAEEVLAEVGLGGYGKRYPYELSGGQQQRVSLARALVIEPTLLLLDEPFSALDPLLKVEMQQLVKTVHQQTGVTTICVTHDQEEAFYLSDRIALMQTGEVVQVADPQTLYRSPATLAVAKFLGYKNFIPVKVEQDSIVTSFGTYAATISIESGKYQWAIPSEAISLKGSLQGLVKEVVHHKGYIEAVVEVEGHELTVRKLTPDAQALRVGDSITIGLPDEDLVLLRE